MQIHRAGSSAQISDNDLPTALLTQVVVAMYQDRLPPYSQERVFGGLAGSHSRVAQWVRKTSVHLQPLMDALKAQLLAFPFAQRRDAGGNPRPRHEQGGAGTSVKCCTAKDRLQGLCAITPRFRNLISVFSTCTRTWTPCTIVRRPNAAGGQFFPIFPKTSRNGSDLAFPPIPRPL